MGNKYKIIKAMLSEVMGDIEYLSLTSDIVTLTNSTRGFLVVTVQFLNPVDNILESFCLSAQRIIEVRYIQ